MKNENSNIYDNYDKVPVDQFTEGDPLQEDTETVSRKRGFGGACLNMYRNITLEPTMVLFVLSSMLSMLTTQNLSLEKACRVDLKLPDDVCRSLKLQDAESQNDNEKQVQVLVSKYIASRTYLTATVPCIMALLAGTWTDQTGRRKIFLIIPLVGQILCNVNNITNVYFFDELSLKYLIFGEAFFEAFSGGWCVGFLTMFAYISTISSPETRTFRIGLVNFCLTVGIPIGMGLNGILLKKTGYYGCYGVSLSLHLVNLLYNILYIKDPPRTPEQKQHDNKGVVHFFRTFFNLVNIKNTLQVVFKNGPNNRRLRMCVMMIVVSFLFGPMYDQFTEGDPLQGDTETVSRKRGFRGACMNMYRNITVEPTMGLFVLSCILTMLTTQNLSLEKACRVDLKLPDDVCRSLKLQDAESQNENEKQVQVLLSKYIAARTYLTATVPCIMALLAGTWSDQTGRRKIFLIIPIVGQILCNVNNVINVYFFDELSLKYLIFGEAFFEAFSGGWSVGLFTMFAFISTISSPETRTFRIGLVNFSLTVGFPIGMGISGILLKKGGYYGCYGVSSSLHLVNLLYNIFYLKDPPRTPEQKQHDNKGVVHFFRTFFNLVNIKNTFQVVFKNGPNNRRLRMCVMMIVVSFLFGPMFGEISIMYLSTRYRFNWDALQFSFFQTYNFVTHTIGTIFSITVFSKYLQWHDSLLGIISTVSKIAASFVYCFAPNATIFFLAPMVEILNGTSLLAIRSIVSKLVAPDELGKANSLIGLTENLMPLVYVPLYTSVYSSTMEVLPGAVFLMGAAMTLPAVIVFIWLLIEHLKSKRKMKYEKREENAESLMKPS